MQLSSKAQAMAGLLLKHYPAEQASSGPTPQHLHDYRKEREIYEQPTPQKL